jgi:hypothetical protein
VIVIASPAGKRQRLVADANGAVERADITGTT